MASSSLSSTPTDIHVSHGPAFTRLLDHLKDVTQNPSVTLDQALLLGLSKEVAGMHSNNIE